MNQRPVYSAAELAATVGEVRTLAARAINWLDRRLFDPDKRAIRRYIANGRRPWSHGYDQYRWQFAARAVADEGLLDTFRAGRPLPPGYGFRLCERCVEFPWVIAHLRASGRRVLDAGSTLNHRFVLSHPAVREKVLMIYTLAPESFFSPGPNVSYVFGDLRSTVLRDGCVDAVTCISTLEHVGMDNTYLYTRDARYAEHDTECYRQVVAELRRVLAPGGVALITVPFGRREDYGWAQQFDRKAVEDIIATFGGRIEEFSVFKYLPDGWVRSTPEDCADCRYFDIHASGHLDPDFAAAARAVACLRLTRA